jgi:hypothetical protein
MIRPELSAASETEGGAMADEPTGGNPGPATDRDNEPVIDPTKNVIALNAAANKRQDDLREMSTRHLQDMLERDRAHIEQILAMRAEFAKEQHESDADHLREIRVLETNRIDAIRAVDVAATAAAATAAENRAGTLAAQVSAAAEAMRTANADAIAGAQSALSIAIAPLMAAVQEVQRRQYEEAGAKANVVESRDDRGDRRGSIGTVLGVIGGIFGFIGILLAAVAFMTR